jgi:DNA-binding CsgD family transcriptional regulator
MAQGNKRADVALKLGLSIRTVDYHMGHIYQKFGVNCLVDAVITAVRLGLIDTDFVMKGPK